VAYPITTSVKRQRSEAPRAHGGRSQVAIRRRAGYLKQSILQPLGIRHAELDQIARRYLDLYVRVLAKIELYDEWAAEHGYLDEEGRPPAFVRDYFAAVNSAGRLLSKLEAHLDRHQRSGPSPLQRHLASHYIDAEVEEVTDDGGGQE
jgi:hypothetical protein